MRSRLAVVFGLVTLVAACSGSDLTLSSATTTETPTTEATTTSTAPETTASTTTTPAPTTTTTAPPDPTVEGAIVYSDPDDVYYLEIHPSWPEQNVGVEGITAWAVLEAENGFTPNINILVQQGVGSTSLQQFLAEAAQGPELFLTDSEIIDNRIVPGTYGDVGRLEYRGTQGQFRLRFLQIFAIENGNAAVVTFSTTDAAGDRHIPVFEAYLRTVLLR